MVSRSVLILGGDGFCGWPTALRLSRLGFRVHLVDDFSRRAIDEELGVQSLTPICTLEERLASWKRASGLSISADIFDLCEEYPRLKALIGDFRPDAIVHFAEQKSAPYSMKSTGHMRYTVARNSSATTNVLTALIDTGVDAHIVHLGTMGVYGYKDADIELPEGYLDVHVRQKNGELKQRQILHPFDPGSVYHMTKCLDSMLFYYFNKQEGIRVTDLHQGIVWGTHTPETLAAESLINRFDYDGDFGTVLNRFLIQAAIGYPLTVHGAGEQSRAFININDTVRCIELAITNPPDSGARVRIFNQLTEVHRVVDLARLISKLSGVPVQSVSNPRTEDEHCTFSAANGNLVRLGLKPTTLEGGLLKELIEVAEKYRDRLDRGKIPCNSNWTHTFR